MWFVRLPITKTKSKSTPHVKMKPITTILAALAVGTTLSIAADEKPAGAKPEAGKPAAGAEKPKHDPEAMWKKIAGDKESVTKEEFDKDAKDKAKADAMFDKKDANHDGKLTKEEFMAHGKK